jgi:hypothetical protein
MFQTLLHNFIQWCYYSKDYAFIRDSKYGVPLVQSLHLFGITVLLGTTVALNLRLLGLGFKRIPLPLFADQLWPWAKGGIFLTVGAGILVFLPDPTRYAHSEPFQLKMVLLCLALLYQFLVFHKVLRKDPESRPVVRNVAFASVSLLLWFGVGWSGRAIAFFQ